MIATDVETKFLDAIRAPSLDVRAHNIVTDPLERGELDLVHSRAVLEHLPERDDVLQRLIDALKPGGWLVLVGADSSTVRAVGLPPDETRFFASRFAAMIDVNRSIGFEPTYGRRLGAAFRAAGLTQVVSEGAVIEWSAGHPLAQLYALTFQRLRARAVDQGAITAGEHDRLLAIMGDPRFLGTSHTVFAARGRKVGA